MRDIVDGILLDGKVSGRLAGVLVFALFCGTACGGISDGVLVRARADLRSWQTVMAHTRSVRWVWTDGADSARVTASNRVSHAVLSVDVRRAEGACDGTCGISVAPSAAGPDGETVVDVGLVQRSGEKPVAESAATLAFVGGVNGAGIVVRSLANRDWRRHAEARVGLTDADGNGYVVYGGTSRGFAFMFR